MGHALTGALRLTRTTAEPERALSIQGSGKVVVHAARSDAALNFRAVRRGDKCDQRVRRPPTHLIEQPLAAGLFHRRVIDD
jgi:hypothetical protein